MFLEKILLVSFALLIGAKAGLITVKNEMVTRVTENSSKGLGIYKGNATTMNTHRYLVSLLKKGEFYCSGSIVSENWVLTIADCTKGLTATDLTVVSGSTDGVTGHTYQVAQIQEHPDYKKKTLDYDISCVQVIGKFYYWAKRAHFLPTAEPQDYMTLTVAGYGYTSSSSTDRALLKADMVYLPKDHCKSVFKNYKIKWSDRMACAYNPDKATLCSGDFGDTFVVGDVLYGQFMAGAKSGFCTDDALPVILYDVFQVAEWVHDVTGARYAIEQS